MEVLFPDEIEDFISCMAYVGVILLLVGLGWVALGITVVVDPRNSRERPLVLPEAPKRLERISRWNEDCEGFKWLHQDSLDVCVWVERERRMFEAYKALHMGGEASASYVSTFKALADLNNENEIHQPFVRGKYIFYVARYLSNFGYCLYCVDQHTGKTTALVDARSLLPGKLGAIWVSNDGGRCAYAVTGRGNADLKACGPPFPSSSSSSSELLEVRILDVSTGHHYADKLTLTAGIGALSWSETFLGFFYSSRVRRRQYDDGKGGEKDHLEFTEEDTVFFHRIGRHQDCDVVVYRCCDDREDQCSGGTAMLHSCRLTADEKFLVVETCESRFAKGNSVRAIDVGRFDGRTRSTLGLVLPYVPRMDDKYKFICNKDDQFWFITTKDAPKGRVVRMSPMVNVGAVNSLNNESSYLSELQLEDWVMEDGVAVLEDATLLPEDILLLKYLRNSCHELVAVDLFDAQMAHRVHEQRLYDREPHIYTKYSPPALTKSIMVPLGFEGSIASMQATPRESFVIVRLATFFEPARSLRCDVHRNQDGSLACNMSEVCSSNKHEIEGNDGKIQKTDDHDVEVSTMRLLLSGEDDTLVPVTIYGCTDIGDYQKRSPRACILVAHGGFGCSIVPSYSPAHIAFIKEMKGIVCVVSCRGGGEYGSEWHNLGRRANKRMAVSDVVYAAEFLIQENFTTPAQLGLHCIGSGGLLAGACANERPELFGAIVVERGIFDLLNFEHFMTGSSEVGEVKELEKDEKEETNANNGSSGTVAGISEYGGGKESLQEMWKSVVKVALRASFAIGSSTEAVVVQLLEYFSEKTGPCGVDSQESSTPDTGEFATSRHPLNGSEGKDVVPMDLDVGGLTRGGAVDAWFYEFGYPNHIFHDYNHLQLLSPVHNVRKHAYPPMLLVTNEGDRHIPPQHTYKFLAALRSGAKGGTPLDKGAAATLMGEKTVVMRVGEMPTNHREAEASAFEVSCDVFTFFIKHIASSSK